jgi:hypothetical protein
LFLKLRKTGKPRVAIIIWGVILTKNYGNSRNEVIEKGNGGDTIDRGSGTNFITGGNEPLAICISKKIPRKKAYILKRR